MINSTIDITKQIELLHDLQQQEQELFMNHSDMEAITIYDDIVRLKKSILTSLICSYGSGTIASFINNTKYSQIDLAVNKTLSFLFHATEEEIYGLSVDNESIAKLVKQCYKNELETEE